MAINCECVTWQVKQELLSLAEAGKQPFIQSSANYLASKYKEFAAQLGTWKIMEVWNQEGHVGIIYMDPGLVVLGVTCRRFG